MSNQGFFRGGNPLRTIGRQLSQGAAARRKRAGVQPPTLETLEERLLMTGSTTPITFSIPQDVVNLGIYAEVSGTLSGTTNYINNAGVSLAPGTVVYFNQAINDYAAATSSTNLVFSLSGTSPSIAIPNVDIKGGQIVIGVGSPPNVTYNATGIATPTANTNPYNYFGLVEYAYAGGNLDVDLSEVDQTGFPIWIATDPVAANPANDGVGIALNRGDTFSQYSQYISTLTAAEQSLFDQTITAGNGYRIISPSDLFPNPDYPVAGSPSYSSGGTLSTSTTYYYWITATNGAGRETTASNVTVATPYQLSVNGQNYSQATVQLTWAPFPEATGYNIYRSTTDNVSTARFVGNSASTTFSDPGNATSAQAPPTSSYTFNPLSSYFTTEIDDFFQYYTAGPPTATSGHTFTLTRDSYNFTGNTQSYWDSTTSTWDTVLVLTAPGLGGQYLIYEPYFSTNTGNAALPPAPTWMPHPDQSPGEMIFAADGVFNTGGGIPGVTAQPGLTLAQESILSDLENSIDSAFNRGIANNFAITPNNWADEPLLQSATATTGGHLATDTTYYYVISAVNEDGTQSTASIERKAKTSDLATDDLSITLAMPQSTAYAYNVFRSTTQGSGYELITRVINTGGTVTSITDHGAAYVNPMQVPFTYYAPGSLSNWYSAALHQNWSNNPTSGISINSLAYGFPYDDQGGQSTNVNSNFNSVTINIGDWTGSPTPTPDPSTNLAKYIKILTQPTNGAVNASNSVQFEILNEQQQVALSATTVTIKFFGAQSGTFTATTNAATGIGTYTFTNSTAGQDMLQLQLPTGGTTTTLPFTVTSGYTSTSTGWGLLSTAPQASVQVLGANALPATDVPNGASTAAFATTAVPWALIDGGVNALDGVTRSESLETSALGIFARLARAGHNVQPELLPEANGNGNSPTSQATPGEDEVTPRWIVMDR
ncbi:MAG TPA: hypothetical protein VGG64_16010 [Pirellulales bacterium]|jgi:hypothetical protein